MTEPKKIKVGLLEDEPRVTTLVMELLTDEGFEVFHSPKGTDEWLKKLKNEGVKHFLLDVEQEKKPLGLAFAEKIKEKIEDAKIIMMSGNPSHEKKAREIAARDFIPKPFAIKHFIEVVKTHFT
ncbi:response regulator [Candidatus Micrarchaeota archaeon]|nr:response regulator [Candidatus Micrarchaeota archaeon]